MEQLKSRGGGTSSQCCVEVCTCESAWTEMHIGLLA